MDKWTNKVSQSSSFVKFDQHIAVRTWPLFRRDLQVSLEEVLRNGRNVQNGQDGRIRAIRNFSW